MEHERGFTLVEVIIAVGIIALVAVGAVGAGASARSMAVTTAADRFDQLLDAARTEAREFPHGVTIAFAPDAYGDGFVARLYQNRPGTEPLGTTTIPPLQARVSLRETDELGVPSFAIAIHANGTIGGFTGDVTRGASTELNCPDSQHFHFTFAYAGFVAERYIPCRIQLAATGPVALITYATATPQPSPSIDVCSGTSCPPTPPPQPVAAATCPPNSTASGNQCLTNLFVCSGSPSGTVLGPDADGVHMDVASGVPCSAGSSPSPTGAPAPQSTITPFPGGGVTPSPSPLAAPLIVEAQQWAVYSGPHGSAVQIDGDLFVLYSDGSEGEGAPSQAARWNCTTQQAAIPQSIGGTWGGFYRKPFDQTFDPRYDYMYQEANNTGGDGYLALVSDQICP